MPKARFFRYGFYLLIVMVSVSLVFIFLKRSKRAFRAENMDLLIVTIDTCRADRIGAYGHPAARTPSLDRLAHRGILFENCYTSVPLTLPSHCSLFTGRFPVGHQVRNNGRYFLNPSQTTLAEKMKDQGYLTSAVVAAFVLLAKFGLDQGFDSYDDTLDTHRTYNNFNSEMTAGEVYEKFSRWFDKNGRQKFFCWLHFYDPHAPYAPPREYAGKFPNSAEGLYDGEIAFVDATIGRIIKDLEGKGVLENTVIVVCGDHGEAFGEHGEFEHGVFCYEEALRVPLIFYNEHLFPQARSVRQRVNLVDVMPTLCDLYAVEIPESVQGRSLVRPLRGDEEKTGRTFYVESLYGKEEMNWSPLMGVVAGPYKYLSLPEPELYDLERDPGEKNNLFRDKNDLARELDGVLKKFIADHAGQGAAAGRELTREDREHLQSLGYISAFSTGSPETVDPKQGIVLDNEIKTLLIEVEEGKIAASESRLKDFISRNPAALLPALYDVEYLIQVKKNLPTEALGVLEKAMDDWPTVDRFYILSAMQLFKMKRDDEAERRCRELLEMNPLFAGAYILLGEICEKRNDIDGALANVRKALEIEPHNISLKIKSAELSIIQMDYASAAAVFDELAANADVMRNAELLTKIALFHTQFGTLDKAETLLRRAVEIAPKGKYYFDLALVLAKNKKIEEALRNMETVLSLYSGELSLDERRVAQKAVQLWKQTPGPD